MAALHQFLAGYAHGDAISNEARVLRGFFRRWGFQSEIFCETLRILPELRADAVDLAAFPASPAPDDIVMLHLSVGSVVNERFRALPCRKAILYHNITPAHYFSFVNPRTATLLEAGRRDMERLAGVAEVTMADTQFNANELAAAGYDSVGVLPLAIDFDTLSAPGDRAVRRVLDDGLVNVLFVGRCAPNKRIEDVVDAFGWFQRCIEPNSRLILVGSKAGAECYHHLIQARCRELSLRNVLFPGAVPQSELNAYYERACLFLCMSEHEGFCIPLIESMHFNVPILAYRAAAVPETLDGSGVLAREKHFPAIAAMMGEMTASGAFRRAIIEGQSRRLRRFRALDIEARLRAFLAPLFPNG